MKKKQLTASEHMNVPKIEVPMPIGYLELEAAMFRIEVYKPIGWFKRFMLRWCLGLKYHKED